MCFTAVWVASTRALQSACVLQSGNRRNSFEHPLYTFWMIRQVYSILCRCNENPEKNVSASASLPYSRLCRFLETAARRKEGVRASFRLTAAKNQQSVSFSEWSLWENKWFHAFLGIKKLFLYHFMSVGSLNGRGLHIQNEYYISYCFNGGTTLSPFVTSTDGVERLNVVNASCLSKISGGSFAMKSSMNTARPRCAETRGFSWKPQPTGAWSLAIK